MAKQASGGGKPVERGVMGYKPPVGPTNINDPRGPGIHSSASRCGTQGPEAGPKGSSSGGVGIVRMGGENKGCCGTQGKY